MLLCNFLNYFLSKGHYKKNYEEYKKAHNLFLDESSQKLFGKNLKFQFSGDGLDLLENISGESFFDRQILSSFDDAVYIDCGAYTGDTIMQFCQFNGQNHQKIIGIEMEKGNFKDLEKFIKFSKLPNVETISTALFSKKIKKSYHTTENYHFFNANFFASPAIVSSQLEKKEVFQQEKTLLDNQVDVKTETIDSLLLGGNFSGLDFSHTIIKVNAMGADFSILKGAKEFIKRYKPQIVMEHGVRPNDAFQVPIYLDSLQLRYRFFLRQKSIFGDSKTVFYAV